MLKHALGIFPTPLQELKNLSAYLGGPKLFIKRDDLTGLALGGNKTRKLEYLIAEALNTGCDTVVTGGAAQSNHCRQTAAAAAVCGLECHLMLGGSAPIQVNGNLLLDQLCGANIHWCGVQRKGERIPELVDELKSQGRTPFIIPYGGSSCMGAMGYVEAVRELATQCDEQDVAFQHLVFASSSGGTQAGLIVGCALYHQNWQIIGVAIDKEEMAGLPFEAYVRNLTNETAARLKLENTMELPELILKQQYVGEGYGVIGDLEKEAIHLMASKEGILLDPVYSGRAFGALLDMIKRKEFSHDANVLFWHTGGAPALFSYADELV